MELFLALTNIMTGVRGPAKAPVSAARQSTTPAQNAQQAPQPMHHAPSQPSPIRSPEHLAAGFAEAEGEAIEIPLAPTRRADTDSEGSEEGSETREVDGSKYPLPSSEGSLSWDNERAEQSPPEPESSDLEEDITTGSYHPLPSVSTPRTGSVSDVFRLTGLGFTSTFLTEEAEGAIEHPGEPSTSSVHVRESTPKQKPTRTASEPTNPPPREMRTASEPGPSDSNSPTESMTPSEAGEPAETLTLNTRTVRALRHLTSHNEPGLSEQPIDALPPRRPSRDRKK